VVEDMSPSSRKIALVEDGYAVHNITGLRAHIVSRIDGRGYDLTKSKIDHITTVQQPNPKFIVGPYPIRSGQLVYFDDPGTIHDTALCLILKSDRRTSFHDEKSKTCQGTRHSSSI
jgi:hypothetical protein